MSEEKELIFRRFPKEKQDQVRGLVEYATLMGLTGKDLVSIGGKLDRLKASADRKHNLELVKSFDCLPINGKPRTEKSKARAAMTGADRLLDEKFKLKTANGTYTFEAQGAGEWRVFNSKTMAVRSHTPITGDYTLGNISYYRKRRYAILLDIAKGKFALNF